MPDAPIFADPAVVYSIAPTLPVAPVLSLTETELYIGLGRTTVRRLLRLGQLQAIKAGRRTLVLRASCDSYLARLTCLPIHS